MCWGTLGAKKIKYMENGDVDFYKASPFNPNERNSAGSLVEIYCPDCMRENKDYNK